MTPTLRRAAARTGLLVALLAAALTAQGSPSHAADRTGCSPGLGVGLVDAVAGEKDPRALTYVVGQVKPGGSVTRRFQVCNGTTAPLTVQLYGGDASIAAGAFSVDEGRTTGDIASWTHITPSVVTIAPQQRIIASAVLTVPSNATTGERYGVLLAELPAVKNAGGVEVASRVGVRVYLEVARGGDPVSDFTIDSLQAVRGKDGLPAVLAQVHNTGARALDLRGTLTLSNGPGGLSAGPFPAQVGTTLAPGQSAPVRVPLSSAIAGGPWRAVIDMKSGLLERKAEATLTFPSAAGSVGAVVKAKPLPLYKDQHVVAPIAGGLIGLLLLLLALFLLVAWRRKKKEREQVAEPELVLAGERPRE